MLDEKHIHLLQNISTLILLVSLCSIVIHSWTTRGLSQPHLLASCVLTTVSASMMLPYNWDKPLMRARIISQVALWVANALILIPAVVRGRPKA